MKLIALNQSKGRQNMYAIVDEDLFPMLNRFSWCAVKKGNTRYAMTSIFINGKKTGIQMHRMIMGFPRQMIDHKNRDGLDNRAENLRLSDASSNALNRAIKPRSHSKYKGVYKISDTSWRAILRVHGKNKHLGYFNTETDAAEAYDSAAMQEWGNRAVINFKGEI